MGKGSKPRPIDIKKYRGNWDEIQWKTSPVLTPKQEEQVEQALRDSCEESRKQLEKLVKTSKGKAKRYVYR